jgi:hypothetical protein
MEVDIDRWRRLLGAIADLQAVGETLTRQVFEVADRRGRAARDLARLERQRPAAYGPRPAPGQTLEQARQQIRAADAANAAAIADLSLDAGRRPPSLQQRPEAADFDRAWFEQQVVVEGLDAEAARLAERQRELSRRLQPLQLLKSDVERWARDSGVALPGAGQELPPRLGLPTAPAGARPQLDVPARGAAS